MPPLGKREKIGTADQRGWLAAESRPSESVSGSTLLRTALPPLAEKGQGVGRGEGGGACHSQLPPRGLRDPPAVATFHPHCERAASPRRPWSVTFVRHRARATPAPGPEVARGGARLAAGGRVLPVGERCPAAGRVWRSSPPRCSPTWGRCAPARLRAASPSKGTRRASLPLLNGDRRPCRGEPGRGVR